MKKNFLVVCAGSLILAGFAFGLVLSSRMSWTASSSAASAEPQSRPAVLPATAGLPDLSPVAERALKVAANISSTTTVQNNDPFSRFFNGDETMQSKNLGSGVVVSADGYVLTNNHVIGNAGAQVRVTLADGRERVGKIVGVDEVTDLAVVKVDVQGQQTLPWGDSDKLRIAEWVLAIGNPYGEFSGTVTLGIVSTVSRSGVQVGSFGNVIQTDAAINPGNSGGALVNSRGELVGINTLVRGGGAQGIGFAIPSNLAHQIMDELVTHGEIRWGSVGEVQWATMTPSIADRFRLSNISGALAYRMSRDSPAFQAGLRGGDIVVAMNDEKITDADQLERKIIASPVGGRPAKLDVDRSGRRVTLTVPIVKR